VKKLFIVLFLIILFITIFTFKVSAQFVRVISDYANIRPIPDTDSIIICEAFKDEIFGYAGKVDDWVKIKMFSDENRYIHKNLIKVVNGEVPISFTFDNCQNLMNKLKEAEERSILVSKHNHPLSNPEGKEKNINFQKILLDRYIMEVFQELNIPMVACQTVLSQCNEQIERKMQQNSVTEEDLIENLSEDTSMNYYVLNEKIRKEIFREFVRCKDYADVEAMQYYFPGCEDCEKFIEVDIDKYITKFSELTGRCKEKLKENYHISEETLLQILAEALEKGWKKPAIPPIPDCCR